MADDLLAAIVQAGHSNTVPGVPCWRRCAVPAGRRHPPDCSRLGRVRHAALGLVTVYRTLEILLALGLVRKLHLEDGCHTYAISVSAIQNAAAPDRPCAGSASPQPSHHLRTLQPRGGICRVRYRRRRRRVEAQTGYRVRTHWLEMFGVCPECQGYARDQASGISGQD